MHEPSYDSAFGVFGFPVRFEVLTEVTCDDWRDEFLRRYYLWSASISVQEYEAGLPLVRAIQSTAALVFVDYASALTAVQLTALRTGLIKKMNHKGMELAQESISTVEKDLAEQYLNRLSLNATMESSHWRSAIEESQAHRPNQKQLRAVLLDGLTPILGSPVKVADDFSEWRYRWMSERFHVDTYISTGSGFQMSYHHAVGSAAGRPAHPNISILEWLGVAGQTSWDLLTRSQVPNAVETLTRSIQAFTDQVGGLLSGLTPDLPQEEPGAGIQIYIVRVRRHLKNGLTTVALEDETGAMVPGRSLELKIPTRIIPKELHKVGSRLLVTEAAESDESMTLYSRLKIGPVP